MQTSNPKPKPWPAKATAIVVAAMITGAVTLIVGVLGIVNTSRAGQQITVGNIISNVFNFNAAAGLDPPGRAGRQRTTIAGPPARFGVGANATVTEWSASYGFRLFVNGEDKGWHRAGKGFPVTVPPSRECIIEFLGSPDDPSKGKPVNVEFAFSCKPAG